MGQIILNWLAVLFLPLLLGAAMRAACRRSSKAWLITAAGALAVGCRLVYCMSPAHPRK